MCIHQSHSSLKRAKWVLALWWELVAYTIQYIAHHGECTYITLAITISICFFWQSLWREKATLMEV